MTYRAKNIYVCLLFLIVLSSCNLVNTEEKSELAEYCSSMYEEYNFYDNKSKSFELEIYEQVDKGIEYYEYLKSKAIYLDILQERCINSKIKTADYEFTIDEDWVNNKVDFLLARLFYLQGVWHNPCLNSDFQTDVIFGAPECFVMELDYIFFQIQNVGI